MDEKTTKPVHGGDTRESGGLSRFLASEQTKRQEATTTTTTTTTGGFGRFKEPPRCDDSSLKEEALLTEEIKPYAFPRGFNPDGSLDETTGNLDNNNKNKNKKNNKTNDSNENDDDDVDDWTAKVKSQSTSRQGREGQRWLTDPDTGRVIRLVTGCVPIMSDGRILFVTASRKPEWILPKGGWETDETMQESAIRETYEEAGVLGTLGQGLEEIQYETRKSKKRKSQMAKVKKGQEEEMSVDSYISVPDERQKAGEENNPPEGSGFPLIYSFVRMTLFPLYVTEVKESWPESGRFRTLMHIDDAIKMLEARPEFRLALIEVKEKKLHMISSNGGTAHTD